MMEDIRSLLDDVADFIAMVDTPLGGLVSPEMRNDIGRRVDAARAVLARERVPPGDIVVTKEMTQAGHDLIYDDLFWWVDADPDYTDTAAKIYKAMAALAPSTKRERVEVAWSEPKPEPIPAAPRHWLGLPPLRREGAPWHNDERDWIDLGDKKP